MGPFLPVHAWATTALRHCHAADAARPARADAVAGGWERLGGALRLERPSKWDPSGSLSLGACFRLSIQDLQHVGEERYREFQDSLGETSWKSEAASGRLAEGRDVRGHVDAEPQTSFQHLTGT